MTENITLHLDTSGLSDGLAKASGEISRVAREEIAPAYHWSSEWVHS